MPVPQPKANEIVVRVRASALNRGELVVGGAVHGGPEKIGGTETAGEVHAVGAECEKALKPAIACSGACAAASRNTS